jgi:hypothetical protein
LRILETSNYDLNQFAGRMDDFFEGFPVMVEPVTGFLTSSIYLTMVGRTQFGATDAGSGGEH